MEDNNKKKETKLYSNRFSIFQVFCQNCSKLLENKSDFITSLNCFHITCSNCSNDDKCSICHLKIKVEESDDRDQKFYDSLVEKQVAMSFQSKNFIFCQKKFALKHNVHSSDFYCNDCKEEESIEHDSHEMEEEKFDCQHCIKGFQAGFLCNPCATSKNHKHKGYENFDEQRSEINSKLIADINLFSNAIKTIDNSITELSNTKIKKSKDYENKIKKLPSSLQGLKEKFIKKVEEESKLTEQDYTKQTDKIEEQIKLIEKYEEKIEEIENKLGTFNIKDFQKLINKPNYLNNKNFESFFETQCELQKIMTMIKFDKIEIETKQISIEYGTIDNIKECFKIENNEENSWIDKYKNLSLEQTEINE